MYLKFKTVEGYQEEKPLLVDAVSARGKIYLRKNIEEIPTLDDEGNEIGTHYRYEEVLITNEEYEQYLGELQNPGTQMVMQTLSDIQLQLDCL